MNGRIGGPGIHQMEMRTRIDVLVTKVRLRDLKLFSSGLCKALTNISTIVFCRVQITHCFSDSQNRSRFVQIEQIRNRYVKSYAAGGEKCNKKDEIEKRLCKPCESGIIISSL